MQFRIADSFTKSLAKLSNQEQSAAKISVFDLQQDPSNPGLKFHRIENSKDPNFWSIRVNQDIRIIVHKTKASFLVAYVDHHDDAYKWAERRRIETHPKTGAAQIVEVRERIEEIGVPVYPEAQPGQLMEAADIAQPSYQAPLFLQLSREEILGVGVPEDWVEDVRLSAEDTFFDIAEHIPDEAAEALLDYVATGVLPRPIALMLGGDPFDHPDAVRRFRVMENVEELSRALQYPWDRWAVFLHPAQRTVVERVYGGPARVSGSAGTGKTVVALHRAAAALKGDPAAKVLMTTFSAPLANALSYKLRLLVDGDDTLASRATVLPFYGVAKELFVLAFGHAPLLARPEHVRDALRGARELFFASSEFTERFLMSEWTHVVDAWQIADMEAYLQVPRLGRRNRMGRTQRERVWPIFDKARALLAAQGRLTRPMVFARVASYYRDRDAKPFSHIVIDEAQDLGVSELQLLSSIAPTGDDAMFFAGDLGQQIFQEPFSWLALGVDVRGRSSTLKVNYRTSHQIREAADRLLPNAIRDVDGNEEERAGTVSVFNGPKPEVLLHDDADAEASAIAKWVQHAMAIGIEPDEIGIFVRDQDQLSRARAVVKETGMPVLEISERVEERKGRISIGTMHLAKGLEFKAVVVMACDDDVLPLQSRVETASDEMELDRVNDTERQLFYVAITRARDRLVVSGVSPGSEFLEDLS